MSDLTQGTPGIKFELWIASIFKNLGAPPSELEKVKRLAKGIEPSLPPAQLQLVLTEDLLKNFIHKWAKR